MDPPSNAILHFMGPAYLQTRAVKKKLQNYDFTIKRTKEQKIEDCLEAMKVDKEKRFKTELQIIENALENIPFIQKLSKKGYNRQVKECYKVITPLSLSKGECVFYQGDIADNFYILIRGKVNIITLKDSDTLQRERRNIGLYEAESIQNYISSLQLQNEQQRKEQQTLQMQKSTNLKLNIQQSNPKKKDSLSFKIPINNSNFDYPMSSSNFDLILHESPDQNTNFHAHSTQNLEIRRLKAENNIPKINLFSPKNANPFQDIIKGQSNQNDSCLLSVQEKGSARKNSNFQDRNQTDNSSPERRQSLNNVSFSNRSISVSNLDVSKGPNNSDTSRGPSNSEVKRRNSKMIISQLPANIFIEDIDQPQKLFNHGIYLYSNANTINEGESFGEGGLLLKRPRTATVLCNENCDFAVLTHAQYDLILKEIQKKKVTKKINMLVQNMDQNIPFQVSSRLSFAFFKTIFSFNQPVFLQGENPFYVYFLKKGEVEISFNEKISVKSEKIQTEKESLAMRISGNYKFKNTILSSICDGTFFGEEDILHNQAGRSYTARVRSSTATLFRIKESVIFNIQII